MQPEKPTNLNASIPSWLELSARRRPISIDRAGDALSDFSNERRATVSIAPHVPSLSGDKAGRNPVPVILREKFRPVERVSTASTACHAVGRFYGRGHIEVDNWRVRPDSNRQRWDLEAHALPIELLTRELKVCDSDRLQCDSKKLGYRRDSRSSMLSGSARRR